MEKLQIPRYGSGNTFEQLSPKELAQLRVDALNSADGDRIKKDGYDCKICRNKGFIAKLAEYNGGYSYSCSDCRCVETRNSILRMMASGLKNVIRDYTFDKFDAHEQWQYSIKQDAMEYAKAPNNWFVMCGQSGAGKTHLCTAVCREFLLAGRQVRYMLWRDDAGRIKKANADSSDSEEYARLMHQFKTAPVLYIDDLFKVGKATDGIGPKPTSADINIAFEILNYRRHNPELLTIISTELTPDELIDVDEGVAGRICEGSKVCTISRDRKRNHRLKGVTTV